MNEHTLLGAYLLGGLEPAEALAFEEHLAGCAACRRELAELESLPALLDAVPVPDAVTLAASAGRRPAVEPPAAEAPVLLELAARRRKSRRWRAVLVAGVAAACLAGGLLAGPAVGGLLNPPPKPDASYSLQAENGMQLTVGLVKKTWGTELELEGRSMPLEGTLYLWVKDRAGGEELACGWTATPSGRIKVTGATPVQLAGISGVELRDEARKTVAAVSVP
ncbi:anti-sigma factor family protein [Arthrobacter celericrescens]|uniref:anti-sigma factor family protein n=1 Tax=Arthrobacter celericrescens TaxID=2320851 RepID=UPI000EA10D3B|nr:zf-HC2 domain-containing protein [Arthrobacter celericrescens]